VALGARPTPFFAIQIVVGRVVVAITPLVGAGTFVWPRFDRNAQRELVTKALPVPASLLSRSTPGS